MNLFYRINKMVLENDPEIILDHSIDPGNNFYNYVNNNWIKNTEIPADDTTYSAFQILNKTNVTRVKELLEQNLSSQDKIFQKASILYCQINDMSARLNKENFIIINKIINQIKLTTNSQKLFDLIIQLSFILEIDCPINFTIQSNYKNADNVILHLTSGGLGLPEKNYYFLETKREFIAKYKDFIRDYSKLFNVDINPNIIVEIETKLANKTYSKAQKRIPELNDNLTTWDNFVETCPNLKYFKRIFQKAEKQPGIVNLINPDYIYVVNQMIESESLENWKQYFILKIIVDFNKYLSEQIEQTYFDFYEKILNGTISIGDQWKRSVNVVESLLGEIVGKMYSDKYFSLESKNQAHQIFGYIKNELELCLLTNNWMDCQTKIIALEKLKKMKIKIGYPEKYIKNYEDLQISLSSSLIKNILTINKFNMTHYIKTLYEPLNRDKWSMFAHTVNAYYSSSMNEIVFPAGILQKPFFSRDQDMASNFGGFGMIVGHEITHGFDDQGCKFDSNGNLKNWWSVNDLAKYKERTELVKLQYSSYQIEGEKINGTLTLGENIADIGGVEISLGAYKKYLLDNKDNDTSKIKTFFISYANIWKSKSRKEDVLQRILTDPHSPPLYRVNGVLRNIDDFYNTFNIKSTHELYLNQKDRIKIWL